MHTSNLNASQEAAVTSDASHILLLASAGSGKTRALVSRIERLILDGTDPEKIVAITFTQKAAEEIRHRVSDFCMSRVMTLGHCGTLHSFLLRLIQEHYEKLGYPSPRLAVLDESEADALLLRCAAEVGCASSLKTLKYRFGRGEKWTGAEHLALKRYRFVMRSNGVISYDGILLEAKRLLDCDPPEIPFEHLLVDEVQDATPLHAWIYEAVPIPNKFYVGDPDQSVFGCFGASADFINDKAREIELTGRGELYRLEENYRSDRAICAAAQRLIEHNENRVTKVLRPVNSSDGIVRVLQFPNETHEKGWVINELRKSVFMDGVMPNSAILLRTNRLVAEWSLALMNVGVPVATRVRPPRPSDWPVVKAALAVLNDPENDWLAYSLIRLKDGEESANAIRLAAVASGQSINQSVFHLSELPIASYTSILARLGASSQSLELVRNAITGLPDGATGTDLMALLAESEHREDEIGEGVTVSTIHSAKGREFDCVFLPAFEQEIIPGNATGPDLEELRRLAFVGMTRARHRLFISFCEQRKPQYSGWQPQPATPSQFIQEAGL